MADENKKVSAENTKPAKQVKDKKAEKPAKTAKVKDKKPNVFVRMGRSIKKFFKELRGESKNRTQVLSCSYSFGCYYRSRYMAY